MFRICRKIMSDNPYLRKFWEGDIGSAFYKTYFGEQQEGQLPIIYHPHYNISLCGIEQFHPFDSKKYGHVAETLIEGGMIPHQNAFTEPLPLVDGDDKDRLVLSLVHSDEYLTSLTTSEKVYPLFSPVFFCSFFFHSFCFPPFLNMV